MKRSTLAISIGLLSLFVASSSFAESEQEIVAAAKAVASGSASDTQKAIAFKNNKTINYLAMGGAIEPEVYQKNQAAFEDINHSICEQAAKEHGLQVGSQTKTSNEYKPGTDSDKQLSSEKGKLSAEDVAKARKAYNEKVESYLKKNGVDTEGERNWAKKLDTDLMPNPDQMGKGEFAKSADLINEDGGNMYHSKDAADTERSLRAKGGAGLAESEDYAREMKQKVSSMDEQIKKIQANKAATPYADLEIQKLQANKAKYIQRIDNVAKALGGEPVEQGALGATLANAQKRTAQYAKDAAIVGALDQHLVNKALANYTNTVSNIAKSDPASAAKCQSILARMGSQMPPSSQGDFIDGIRASHGDAFAKDMVAQMKKINSEKAAAKKAGQPATATGEASSSGPSAEGTLKTLGYVGAITGAAMNEIEAARREGRSVSYGKIAMEAGLAISPPGRFVNAARAVVNDITENTTAYRQQLEKKYKDAGYDMDSGSVKMAIWASATAYGTARGVYQAGYQGVHLVPVVGDLVGAAETAAIASYETALTIKTLNDCYNVRKENSVIQMEQSGRSVASGRKMLSDMQTLAESARALRERLSGVSDWAAEAGGKALELKAAADNAISECARISSELGGASNAAELLDKGSLAKLETEYKAIKAVADSSFKRASKILEESKKDSFDKAASEKDFLSTVSEMQLNGERLQTANERLGAIAALTQAQDKLAEFAAQREAAENCLKSLRQLSAAAAKMPGSFAESRRQLAEVSACFDLIKGKLRDGYEYFWVKNDKGSAEWESIWGEANCVKMPRPSEQELKKDADYLGRLKESLESYLKQAKAPETPKDAGASQETARRGKEAAEALLAPANAAETAMEAANAQMDKVAALFGKNAELELTVNVVDGDGNPIFGATVKASGQGPALKQPAGDGGAKFNLPPGKYKLEASADGYAAKTEAFLVEAGAKPAEMTIKLSAGKGAVRQEEKAEEKAEEPKRPAPQVADEDMKRAESLLSSLRSMASRGIVPTRDNILQGRAREFLSALSGCSEAKSHELELKVTLLLDPSNGAMLDAIDAGVKYGIREMAFRACENWNRFDGLMSAALMKNGLAREAKRDPKIANEAERSAAVVELCRKFSLGYGCEFSSLLGWKAYCEFHGRKLSNGEAKPAAPLKHDASHWLKLVQAGGYDALAKELDAFWGSQEAKKALKDVSAFQSKWPDAVKDYRDKFIAETILPQLKEQADASRTEASKEVAAAARRFAQLFNGASMTVSGNVDCVPDQAPITVRLKGLDSKKELESQGASFSYTLPLKNVGSYMSCYASLDTRRSSGEFLTLRCPNGGHLGINPANEDFLLGGEVKTSGFSYTLKFRPFKCFGYRKWERPFKDSDGTVQIPQYPADRSQEFADRLNSILSALEGGSLPRNEADLRMSDVRNEFRAYDTMMSARMGDAIDAMSHNINVQEKLMANVPYEQKKGAFDQMRAQRDSVRDEKARREKASNDIDNAAGKRYVACSNKLNALGNELSQKAQALNKSMDAPRQESWKSLSAFEKGIEKWLWLRSYIQSSHQWRDYPNWDPENMDSYQDKTIVEMLEGTEGKQEAPLRSALSAAEKLAEARKEAMALFAEALKLERLEKNESALSKAGFPLQADGSLRGGHIYISQLESDAESILKAESLRDGALIKACAGDIAKCKAYLKRRGGVVQDLEAEVAALEQAAGRLPDAAQLKAAGDRIKELKDRMIPYLEAVQAAVLAGSARNVQVPKSTLDAKGSDSAFVSECLSVLRDALEASSEITGDYLPKKHRRPNCFASLYYDWNSSSKWSKASPAQQERMRKVSEKYAAAVRDSGDIFMVCVIGFFEDIQDAGSTPSQRVERLLEMNAKAAKELSAWQGRLPSADANDIAKFFGELNDWFGLMPDIPTLENLKARAAIYKAAYASGRIAECRRSLGKPQAPDFIEVLGQKVPLDGSCLVFRLSQLPEISPSMAKSYEKTEWAGKFKKSLVMRFIKNEEFNLEFAFGDYSTYSPWYDYKTPYEFPVSKEFLPMRYQMNFRNAAKDSKLNSQLKNEPPLSVIVLP